jgi:hypothetical protein
MAWMALVSSMIWLEKRLVVRLLLLLHCCTVCHWWSARAWRFSPARQVLADDHEGRQEYGF